MAGGAIVRLVLAAGLVPAMVLVSELVSIGIEPIPGQGKRPIQEGSGWQEAIRELVVEGEC